jgi:hypothetical protein
LHKPLVASLALAFIFWGTAILWANKHAGASGPVFGGSCEYKSYPGQTRIKTIQEVPRPDEAVKKYEVSFTFEPNEEIAERFARTEGRTYLLLLENGTYPDQHFLRKYGIERGQVFDCILKVITRGTCTPILFKFPGIDLGDYGEKGVN